MSDVIQLAPQPRGRGRPTKLTPERMQQIRNLVERGKIRDEIAEIIGVTTGTLQVTCSKLGTSLRRPTFDTGDWFAAATAVTFSSEGVLAQLISHREHITSDPQKDLHQFPGESQWEKPKLPRHPKEPGGGGRPIRRQPSSPSEWSTRVRNINWHTFR